MTVTNNKATPTIYIDADGCPVIDQSLALAKKYAVSVFLVCDTSHIYQKPGAQNIVVGKGADSADFALANQVDKNDIVITQDYGLAALCLAKQAWVMHQDGFLYTDENIASLLLSRHTAKKIRRAGGRLKGPAKRTALQNNTFCTALEELLKALTQANGT